MQIQSDQYESRSQFNMTDITIRVNYNTDMHTWKMSHKDKSRDGGDLSTRKERQRLLRNHQKLEKKHRIDFYSQLLGINFINNLTLDFSLQNYETMSLCCLRHSVVFYKKSTPFTKVLA